VNTNDLVIQISIANFPEEKTGMHRDRQRKEVVNKEWKSERIKSKRS
jgi:hypothetical protein